MVRRRELGGARGGPILVPAAPRYSGNTLGNVPRYVHASPDIEISGGFETVDGCPVVHLVDCVSDLALFIVALYGAGKK